LSIKRYQHSGVSPNALWVLAALLFLAGAAHPQVVPYITDVFGEEDIVKPGTNERPEGGGLRLIGTFKLFNPDTVPFYIWITFDNGGKFIHTKYRNNYPSVRLVDLELRYKDVLQRPMVKKFPNSQESRVKKRFGGSWLGGGRPSGKKGSRGRRVGSVAEDADDIEVGNAGAEATEDRGGRGHGASEITFWKEDAQTYYEMELWGALYAPDMRNAGVAGNYVENIKFEIEAIR